MILNKVEDKYDIEIKDLWEKTVEDLDIHMNEFQFSEALKDIGNS